MDALLKRLTEKKGRLDSFRPLSQSLVRNLDEWFRVELTYTSNAIEGNTLSRIETSLVVEKGITVSGKTLTEHLEAINHAEALDFIKELVNKKRVEITKRDLLQIHWLILKKIDDDNAGRYRTTEVKISGVDVLLPTHVIVPELMEKFFDWLHGDNNDHPAKIAADAHLKLVTIHPFSDGNGRVTRLLLNLLLLQEGYPPALIRKEDRKIYIERIGKAQIAEQQDDYYRVICRSIDRSFNIYLKAVDPQYQKQTEFPEKQGRLLKIGELAKETGETPPTIRYWTKEGILEVKEYTKGGYQLYEPAMIGRVREIRRLQKEDRLSIAEIKKKIIPEG